MRGITLLFVITWTSFSYCKTFIVDTSTGDDSNSGDIEEPLKTIGECIARLDEAGDECLIREGRYREVLTISGLRGSAENPISIRGYKGEKAVLDGTVHLDTSNMVLDPVSGICSTPIKHNITALFLKDEMLTAARWPNALWSDKTVFNNSFWGKFDASSSRGEVVDAGGLAESGINATGTMAILNIGSFQTFVSRVEKHSPGTPNFFYNDTFGNIHYNPRICQYYLEAGLELLDTPGEWYYDHNSGVLHMIPPTGSCPTSHLRGRVVDYGIEITNTTGLVIADMTLFATSINAHSVDSESNIDQIKLDSLEILHGSSSHRMLGSAAAPLNTRLHAKGRSKDLWYWVYGKISIINCTFHGSDGQALNYEGKDVLIHNNLFSYNDWTGHSTQATLAGCGGGAEISQNTLWYNGASAGIRPLCSDATVSMNRIVGQCAGKIMNDGAGIQVQTKPQQGASVSHNWVHDSPKFGIRFDSSPGHLGYNGYQGYNVVWNAGGLMVKGDNHTVMNNLAMKDNTGDCSLCVIYRIRNLPEIMNNNTVVMNNAATKADGGVNTEEGGGARWPVAGAVVENNFSNASVEDYLYDPANQDFRPVEGGALVEGEDIIGPYLPDNDESEYWIPGRRLYKTSNPIPGDGASVLNRDCLIFQPAYNAESHDVYFGEEFNAVDEASEDDDTFQYSTATATENMVYLKMEEKKTYFWRVDAKIGDTLVKGDTWSFSINP